MSSAFLRVPADEGEFAAFIDDAVGHAESRESLLALLEETHELYADRGAAAIARMRTWVLLALARARLPDSALVFALEELDTGHDPYPIAAASAALRTRNLEDPRIALLVVTALVSVRERDDFVSLDNYGGYSDGRAGTTAVRELLATLTAMGPAAVGVLPDLERLASEHSGAGASQLIRHDFATAAEAIRCARPSTNDCCDWSWPKPTFLTGRSEFSSRVQSVVLQDHDGEAVRFDDYFSGKPAVVVFFYTRCDNPRKCSLSIAKLAVLQRRLAERGLGDELRTAAITYDPAWDSPDRLKGYALGRGVRLDANNRMFRSTGSDLQAIRGHFSLGVSFVESLVSRHRVELAITDRWGRVAAGFDRLQWDVDEVADRAAAVLSQPDASKHSADATPGRFGILARDIVGPAVSVGIILAPKCSMCVAAYLTMIGVGTVGSMTHADSHSHTLGLVLFMAMVLNLISVALRGLATRKIAGPVLSACGAALIAVQFAGGAAESIAVAGVFLTIGGSIVSVASTKRRLPARYFSTHRGR